jgi:hypothetical protein
MKPDESDASQNYVRINLNGGNTKCIAKPEETMTMQMDVKCGSSNDDFTVWSVIDNDPENPCQVQISATSRNGCRVGSISALWAWMNSNKWVMFVIFTVVGFFVCFFGRKLFKPVLFLAGIFLVVSLVMIVFYSTFL